MRFSHGLCPDCGRRLLDEIQRPQLHHFDGLTQRRLTREQDDLEIRVELEKIQQRQKDASAAEISANEFAEVEVAEQELRITS